MYNLFIDLHIGNLTIIKKKNKSYIGVCLKQNSLLQATTFYTCLKRSKEHRTLLRHAL